MEFIRFKRLGVTRICSANDTETARRLIEKGFTVDRDKKGKVKTMTEDQVYWGKVKTVQQSIDDAADAFDKLAENMM